MRYFLHIGFEGTNYSGWQRQPNVSSVQETIEDALKRIFKTDITVYGCGRTDSGVHASQYILHINLDEALSFDLKYRLNKNLPDDIAVYDVIEMDMKQHSRYDATWRTYDYFIHRFKDPVLNRYSSYYELEDPDFESMKKAVSILPQHVDFRSFCRRPNLYKHTNCQIKDARFYVSEDGERLRFTIAANRFLHGMIRICVFFLLKVGNRTMTYEEFEHMLSNQLEAPVKRMAIPNGLFLSKVEYPYLKIETRTDICSFLKTGLEDKI